jgi:hypothetical protein
MMRREGPTSDPSNGETDNSLLRALLDARYLRDIFGNVAEQKPKTQEFIRATPSISQQSSCRSQGSKARAHRPHRWEVPRLLGTTGSFLWMYQLHSMRVG